MIKQTLAFLNPANLTLRNHLIVIDTLSDAGIVTRPIEDVGLLVIESRGVNISSGLINALLDNNVVIVVCDDSHIPHGLMLPISGNSITTERSHKQIASSLPLRKQLWQQTVSAKIRNQHNLLKMVSSEECGCMEQFAKKVRSGDPDNLEARAAVFYWKNIFSGRTGFLRSDESDILNSYLNYGYAILRAIVARAVVASGLLPQIGLFHSNKFNPFCLADDLMEPFRPFVDLLVIEIADSLAWNLVPLNKEIKRSLLSIPTIDVRISRRRHPLMIGVNHTVASLVKCYYGRQRTLYYPELQ